MNAPGQAERGNLHAFQDAFATALLAPPDALPSSPQVAELVRQPGFAVYRNTVMRGCIDALQANYPAVSRLVGDEWFRAAAAIYLRGHLPIEPSLLAYGDRFADFLDSFEPAQELPYLAGVARLDRFWTEAHVARDETAVTAAAIARLAESRLAGTVLLPHASARWAWFDEQPIYTIWSRNREQADFAQLSDAPEIDWQAEGVLLVRSTGRVTWALLSGAGCAFMDRCAEGGTLAAAADAALRVDPKADLSGLMAQLLNAGAFSRLAHASS
ncbi:MAG: DNA-binding domain-containing protein [Casimicrobiaceae bacterium]